MQSLRQCFTDMSGAGEEDTTDIMVCKKKKNVNFEFTTAECCNKWCLITKETIHLE